MCERVVRSGQHLALCIQKSCTQEACTQGAAHKGAAAFTTKTASPSSNYNFRVKIHRAFLLVQPQEARKRTAQALSVEP